MRYALTLTIAIACLFSCERQTAKATERIAVPDRVESEKPMIRYIRFNDSDGNLGVELNGDRAYLHQDLVEPKRTEIPFRDGLSLLEEFYAIPQIEDFRGKKSDDRQTSIQYLVFIYDEMPERYSEDWVDYIIPKNSVALHPELGAWFENMRRTKKIAEAEQGAADRPLPTALLRTLSGGRQSFMNRAGRHGGRVGSASSFSQK